MLLIPSWCKNLVRSINGAFKNVMVVVVFIAHPTFINVVLVPQLYFTEARLIQQLKSFVNYGNRLWNSLRQFLAFTYKNVFQETNSIIPA